MFRPIPAIIPFPTERVLVFIRIMRVCNDGGAQYPHYRTPPSPQPRLLIVVIIKTSHDEISPSLHNRINLINTKTLSDENLMMAGIGRNM